MIIQKTGAVSGAIAAVAMLAAQISPAAAVTVPSPAATEKAVSPQVEKAYWCRWGCGHGWGWRGGWGPAGLGLSLRTLGLLGTGRGRRRSGHGRSCRGRRRKFVLASCRWPLWLALGARVLTTANERSAAPT